MAGMTMIERVARAIEDEGPVGCCTISPEKALSLARAAIEAMREPTDAMVDAGWRLGDTPAKNFVAMIDAALNEQVSG